MSILFAVSTLVSAFSPAVKTTWRDLAKVDYDFSFDSYCAEYSKSYTGAERERRAKIFDSALKEIKAHNNGNATYKMGLSEHTDKDDAEWKALKGLHRGLLFSRPRSVFAAPKQSTNGLADAVDWRTKGVVTPVKNQGDGSGSCKHAVQPCPCDRKDSPAGCLGPHHMCRLTWCRITCAASRVPHHVCRIT